MTCHRSRRSAPVATSSTACDTTVLLCHRPHGMGQRLVAIGALLVEAVFEQMSPLIFASEACCQKCTPRKMVIEPYQRGHSMDPYD
jgi:hypothetical protein